MHTSRIVSALVFVLLAASLATAQETKISQSKLPKAVLEAFKAAYPSAEIKGSSKEKEDGKWTYEIESLDGKTKRDIAYAADGKVLETEETVELSTVPGDAAAAIAKLYPTGTVTRAEKSTTDKGTQYEVHVKVGKKTVEVKFDADGKLVIPPAKTQTKKSGKKESSEEKEDGKGKGKGKDKDDDDDDDSPNL